jgi:hypothetical protein
MKMLFDDAEFDIRVELVESSFENLPSKARIWIECPPPIVYKLVLQQEWDGRTLSCEIAAESADHLIEKVQDHLGVESAIGLFVLGDDWTERELMGAATLKFDPAEETHLRVRCADLESQPEVEPEPEWESEPNADSDEPEIELPEPPTVLFRSEPGSEVFTDQRRGESLSFVFRSTFTERWWKQLCSRPARLLYGPELCSLHDCWPQVQLQPDIAPLIDHQDPTRLSSSATVRRFVSQFGAAHTVASRAFRLFAAQNDHSKRSWDLALLLLLCNPQSPIQQRLQQSFSLLATLGGPHSDTWSSSGIEARFLTHLRSISDAVCCRMTAMSVSLCGGSTAGLLHQDNAQFSHTLHRAIDTSMAVLQRDFRTATSRGASVESAAYDGRRSVRLGNWLDGLSAFWLLLLPHRQLQDDENLHVSAKQLTAKFDHLHATVDLAQAHKILIQVGLASSVYAHRMAWLLAGRSEQDGGRLDLRSLISAMTLLTSGSMDSKLLCSLHLNGITRGRRWSVQAMQASLYPFVCIALDTLAMQIQIATIMFNLDAAMMQVGLRVASEQLHAFILRMATLADRAIRANESKSASAVIMYCWTQRASVTTWLKHVSVSWRHAMAMKAAFGREETADSLSLSGSSLSASTTPFASLARVGVNLVRDTLCSTSTAPTAALVRVFGVAKFEGLQCVEELESSEPLVAAVAAVWLADGAPYDKVMASLVVLGLHEEAEMGFAVTVWLSAFRYAINHTLHAFAQRLGKLSGGTDERDHSRIQSELQQLLRKRSQPWLVRFCERVERVGQRAGCTPSEFAERVAGILGPLLPYLAPFWMPLLPDVSKGLACMHTSSVADTIVAEFRHPRWEVGKYAASLSAEQACSIAEEKGLRDRVLARRIIWLCDAGEGEVRARDFASTLLLLSEGDASDKKHAILSVNGLVKYNQQWSARHRQFSREILFQAFRPLLLVTMDCAIGHMTGYQQAMAGWHAVDDIVLETLKVRTMAYLEDIVHSLSTPTDTVAHAAADKKLCRWIDTLAGSWAALARHVFGRR